MKSAARGDWGRRRALSLAVVPPLLYMGPQEAIDRYDRWKELPGELGKRAVDPRLVVLGEKLNPTGYDIPSSVDPGVTIHFSPSRSRKLLRRIRR